MLPSLQRKFKHKGLSDLVCGRRRGKGMASAEVSMPAPPDLKPPSKEYLERMVRAPSKEYLMGQGNSGAASPVRLRSAGSSLTKEEAAKLRNFGLLSSVPASPEKTREEGGVVLTEYHKLQLDLQAKHMEAAVAALAPVVDLQAWQAKGLATNWTLADVLGSDIFLFIFLALLLCVALPYLSAKPPTPVVASCTWRWDAFRCSTGCKPRMHVPLLHRSCMPM